MVITHFNFWLTSASLQVIYNFKRPQFSICLDHTVIPLSAYQSFCIITVFSGFMAIWLLAESSAFHNAT